MAYMKPAGRGPVTEEIGRLHAGETGAMDRVADLVYDQLYRLASSAMRRERPMHTLQPTALVNEAFLRLQSRLPAEVQNRVQFFAQAARIMRSILVDHARARSSDKRGGGAQLALTQPGQVPSPAHPMDAESILDIHRALEALEAEDDHLARLMELRFFAGMTAEESAELLNLSVHAIRHDIRLGQAWLKKALKR